MLKKMSEDPKLQVKDILRYAKDVDKAIAFSKWYRRDHMIRPKREGASWKMENNITPKIPLELVGPTN